MCSKIYEFPVGKVRICSGFAKKIFIGNQSQTK